MNLPPTPFSRWCGDFACSGPAIDLSAESGILAASQIHAMVPCEDAVPFVIDEAAEQGRAWVSDACDLQLLTFYERTNRTVERNMADLRSRRAECGETERLIARKRHPDEAGALPQKPRFLAQLRLESHTSPET